MSKSLCAVLVLALISQAVAVKWWADAPCLVKNTLPGHEDSVAVKDPTIVFANGMYHVFYTVRDNNNWRMAYASASTTAGLKTATHTFLSSLNGGGYFCAPQVFYHSGQKKWYLIYQSAGATYSTNSDISNPKGWAAGRQMGFTDGLDYYVIADSGSDNVYAFYSGQDQKIRTRRTSKAAFPGGWSGYSNAVDGFEGVAAYKSLADGKYYLVVEDMSRFFRLYRANSLAGPWSQVEYKWAEGAGVTFNPGVAKWTDQVSHGEIVRTRMNEFMEIDDINHCDMLIQGVLNGNYGKYENIPYQLGVIRNYQGSPPTPSTCTAPSAPANGQFTCTDSTCTAVCNSGYAATGTGYATCSNGNWGTLPACVPTGSGSAACGIASEGKALSVSCASGQLINAVEFASFGNPAGDCTNSKLGSCHALTSLSVMQDACVGKASCSVDATNAAFGDPCSGTVKQLAMRAHCAAVTSQCASSGENTALTLACPSSQTITGISFASYGTPTGSCGSFAKSSCHAASSLDVVQKACVGKNSCTISNPMNNAFGDPCSGTAKSLKIQALCQ